eukprot:IDg8157t1
MSSMKMRLPLSSFRALEENPQSSASTMELETVSITADPWKPGNRKRYLATLISSLGRFILLIKFKEDERVIFKARYDIKGHCDKLKKLMVHSSVKVQPSSIRIISFLAALFELNVWTFDVTQTYLPSSFPLIQDICSIALSTLRMKETRSDPALDTLLADGKLIGLSGGFVEDLLRAGTPAFRKPSEQTNEKFNMAAEDSPPCALSGFFFSYLTNFESCGRALRKERHSAATLNQQSNKIYRGQLCLHQDFVLDKNSLRITEFSDALFAENHDLMFNERLKQLHRGAYFGASFATLHAIPNVELQCSVTEFHDTLGLCEPYHEPLRSTFRKIQTVSPKADQRFLLGFAVKAMNDIIGPEGFILTAICIRR